MNYASKKCKQKIFCLSASDDKDIFFVKYSTRQRSPFINRIIFSLGLDIWQHIDVQNSPASGVAGYIQARNKAWRERGADLYDLSYYLPEEFYMLLADILYHLPTVQGLPDSHELKGATQPSEDTDIPLPIWDGFTAENIRQRFRSEYARFRRRKGI